jgi:hypothetical protein
MTNTRKIRIPTELCEWLEDEAQRQHRSLEGQIAYMLDNVRSRMARGVPVISRGRIVAMERTTA